MATVTCPSCSASYDLTDDQLGKNVKCKCGNRFEAIADLGRFAVESSGLSVADIASQGPPSIDRLKFEKLDQHNELLWGARFAEVVGYLIVLSGGVMLVTLFNQTAEAGLIPTLAPALGFTAMGSALIVLGGLVRVAVKIQHDCQRSREYLHYATWAALTQRGK